MKTASPAPWTDAQRAHLALRLTLGLNLAAHGVVRIGHAGAFADALVRDFQATILPAWTVRPFGLVLPFVELLLGLAVILGLRLRAALAAGALLIAALMVGLCLKEAWEIVGVQLVYALLYFILASRAADARLVIGDLLQEKQGSAALARAS